MNMEIGCDAAQGSLLSCLAKVVTRVVLMAFGPKLQGYIQLAENTQRALTRRLTMANDGGSMYPIAGTQWEGMSVRDGFAMAIVNSEERPGRSQQADEVREVYHYAQLLTDEKLRRDQADRDGEKVDDFLDISSPKAGVQVETRDDGKVLWVSVDGKTVLRISQIPLLELTDNRDEGRTNGS